MELIDENNERKIYQEDNRIYTMVNMGDYIGHRSREWYQKGDDAWYLMFLDEYQNNDKIRHMEALVDYTGRYLRFIIEQGNEKRIVLVGNGSGMKEYVEKTNNKENTIPILPKSEMLNIFLRKNQELQNLIYSKKNNK